MCDTAVIRAHGATWFIKNSDRALQDRRFLQQLVQDRDHTEVQLMQLSAANQPDWSAIAEPGMLFPQQWLFHPKTI